jgi:hypothetical protein
MRRTCQVCHGNTPLTEFKYYRTGYDDLCMTCRYNDMEAKRAINQSIDNVRQIADQKLIDEQRAAEQRAADEKRQADELQLAAEHNRLAEDRKKLEAEREQILARQRANDERLRKISDLHDLTRDGLRKMCTKMGLWYDLHASKEELITFIVDHQ